MIGIGWCDECKHSHAADAPHMWACEDCGEGDPLADDIGHLDFDTEEMTERKELARGATNVLLVWRLLHLMIGARWQ